MAEDFVAGFTGMVRKDAIDIGDDGGELEIDYTQPSVHYRINGERVGEGHAYAWLYRFHARRPETARGCGCNACLAHLAWRGIWPPPDSPHIPPPVDGEGWSDFLDWMIQDWRLNTVNVSLLDHLRMTGPEWRDWMISNSVPRRVRESW